MDIQDILQVADHLVYIHTGKHLDNLQERILKETLQGRKYATIAEDLNYTEGYIKDVASELWRILSDILGENISKSNFRTSLQRCKFTSVSPEIRQAFTVVNNINVCGENQRNSTLEDQNISTVFTHNSVNGQHLADAPRPNHFYGRTSEIATLQQWIIEDRIIAIVGISGMGKTALTLHLIPQVKEHFDCIIWRNLYTCLPLEKNLKNILKLITNKPESELPTKVGDQLELLIECFRNQRCLLILDNLEALLNPGELAGHYQPMFENYKILFKLIGETTHQSCLILNSWELPIEILTLQQSTDIVKVLKLQGLGEAAKEILKNQQLLEEEEWENLIQTYSGNPFWLKGVAATINNLFSGHVTEFLQYQPLFLTEEAKMSICQQFNRLSQVEQTILLKIAREIDPISIRKILQTSEIPVSYLLNGVQSLELRSLIEISQQNDNTKLTVWPVIREICNRNNNSTQ